MVARHDQGAPLFDSAIIADPAFSSQGNYLIVPRLLSRVNETIALWDYRREVADLYAMVRSSGPDEASWRLWVQSRDELFSTHSQSPIDAQAEFGGLPYFRYDDRWRTNASFSETDPADTSLRHSGSGSTQFRSAGLLSFELGGVEASLEALWLTSYGGGIFVPFRDATNGLTTYGGGRYLLDSAKGADLGMEGGSVVLDFNFSYHPSCVHSDRWSCPLAPPSNRLGFSITAGERLSGELGDS